MAQLEQTIIAAPDDAVALVAKNGQLQILVGELLATNQELRFKVNQLTQRAERAEQGLAQSGCAAAVPWP